MAEEGPRGEGLRAWYGEGYTGLWMSEEQRFRITSNKFISGGETSPSHVQVDISGEEKMLEKVEDLLKRFPEAEWFKIKRLSPGML